MQFKIKAYREHSGISVFDLHADTRDEALRLAAAQGLRVIECFGVGEKSGVGMGLRRERFDTTLFGQELLTLLEGGFNIVEAIDTLASKPQSSRVLKSVHQSLKEGNAFSKALEAAPTAFPTLFVATVRSSERTGNLPEALSRYLAYMKQIHGVRDKVIGASIYPILLLGVGALIIIFLLGYVVPRFSKVYEDMGDRLPWMSRILLDWGQFLDRYGLWVGAVSLGVLLMVALLTARLVNAGVLQRWAWRIPGLGENIRTYELARFSRTLAMLLKGGIPFVSALGMVEDLLRQPALRQGVVRAQQQIRDGERVSLAFLENGLANEVTVRMLAVGENSGELGQMVERVAQMHDDEVARAVEWFSRLFEPALMIVIGLVIGFVILLLYLPIFELTNIVQ